MTSERFSVRLVAATQHAHYDDKSAEDLMVYCARVSSSESQAAGNNQEKLLRYCIRKGHWSVFEQASMGVEIVTSRAISAQILRHRSFSFQEFSQRYAKVDSDPIVYEARKQGTTNRQATQDPVDDDTAEWFRLAQSWVNRESYEIYEEAIERGIARECARFLLPLSTPTRLYMHGTVRSWIHYLQARCAPETQAEHREIALAIRDEIFAVEFPITFGAVFLKPEV